MKTLDLYEIAANPRGISKIGAFILILVLSAGTYVGYQVFPFYYYYYEIQNLMDAQARKADIATDGEIRKVLLKQIKKLEIPINSDDDLKINRVGDKIHIGLTYYEYLVFEWKDEVHDIHEFEFIAVTEQKIVKNKKRKW